MNIDARSLKKILANRSQQHRKEITQRDQVEYILGMKGWYKNLKSLLFTT